MSVYRTIGPLVLKGKGKQVQSGKGHLAGNSTTKDQGEAKLN